MGKITKALSCLVVIGILMSAVPVLVVDAIAQQQEENTWIEIVQAPKDITCGGGISFHENALYIMAGGSKDFLKLDLNSDSWTTLANLPEVVGHGADMAFDGENYVYVTKGTSWGGLVGSRKFWRYDINQNIWETLPDTPEDVGSQGSLCYADGFVYLRHGTCYSTDFYRYSTDSQTWEKKASGRGVSPPVLLAAGPICAMTYDGTRYIYTFQGGSNIDGTNFDEIWRYDTWNDQWEDLGRGTREELDRADLVYVEGGLYALSEYSICNFGFFDLSNNNWVRKPDVPCGFGAWNAIGPGASLAYDGTQYIYALNGGKDQRIYRYLIGYKLIDFNVDVTPEKNWYDIGETTKVTIDVTNNRNQDTEIWLGITFQDPEGNEYDIPLERADILKGETKSFDVDWTIHNNAPLGQYGIAVNCWKDEAQTDKYADDLEWELIFNVYNLVMVSPTTSSPVIVGDPSTPAEFNAEVSTGIPLLLVLPGAFNAMIGNKPAGVTVIPSFFDNLNGIYTLQITPPTQDTEGSYELNIGFSLGEVSDYDLEPDAVIYSTGGNIDVVEVIDRSGSMSGEPIQTAKDSAKLFVDLMEINDSIGVASYSSGASVNYGLTKITSDTIKQNAKNAIDGISAGGMTSIGAGLRAAYNELVNKGDPSHPRSIVLMSDGWHNTAPHPDTVLPDIRNANIRVFTIGLGAGADASLLSHIAHDSGGGGGEYYYSPSSEELSAIYNAIAGVVRAESTVKTVTGSIQQGETITHKVDIDPAIDIATFTVTWSSGTLDLGLERPDGSKVDPSDPDVLSHTKEATYETYTIDDPIVGEWAMEITAPSTSSSTKTTTSNLPNAWGGIIANKTNSSINDNWSTEIDVAAKIKYAQKAVAQAGISYTATVTATTNLTVHMYTDKDQYSLNEPMKIITALTKAGSPVTGADVNVTIERPDAAKDYLLLYDDGKHDDGVALDGVYANYYTNTDVSGSYTITVHASGTASPEEFTREVKKSVYVSGVPAGEISVTPTSWDTGIVHPGGDTISAFTVSSTSTKDETVTISATDLTDAYGNIIGSENVISMPSTFVVPASGSGVVYERIYVPEIAKTGNYTGSIVLTSTANSVNIPVTLPAKKLFETDLPNVELLYADPTVTSINVTSLNLSEVNETCKPEECITPQSAYMINSTGAGNFTLKFTDIPNANTIIVYKINATNQWIELDGIKTADTVTFTMSVEDPPVVFCSGAPPVAARVPTLTPIGIIALAGLLAIVAVSRMRRKR